MAEVSSRPPRTLVLCFDGTNKQYSSSNSNVVKFFGLLVKDRPDNQVVYYQPGIGTYFAPGVVSPLWTWWASLLDEAIAWYLDAHVMSGYRFLMDNYRAGDKICLFGFSRGAYTARALAGMLDKVGLLSKGNLQQICFAYKAYKRTDKEGDKLAAGFKETYSKDVKIDFVGVWDTVQSTGILVSRALPFTASNTCIKVFRHALALDEHRARFRPNLYHWSAPIDDPDEMITVENAAIHKFDTVESFFTRLFKRKNRGGQPYCDGTSVNTALQSEPDKRADSNGRSNVKYVTEEDSLTDVLEVWFPGCHSDIGGGNVKDDVSVSLSQITLHWMVEQVMQSGCDIIFDNDKLARIGFTLPSQLSAPCGQKSQDPKAIQPRTSSNDYSEHSDAVAPIFDEMKICRIWWLLEFLPASNAWQDEKGVWHSEWIINMGRGRYIPLQKPQFHHTVKERMNDKSLNYKPRATYDENEVVFV